MLKFRQIGDVPRGRLALKMVESDATALPLFTDGAFGADVIRFPQNGCVRDHTHSGSHILYVLSGVGWIDFEGAPTRLLPGTCYLVPSGARHGIRAETELTILSIANDHRPADSEERLAICEAERADSV